MVRLQQFDELIFIMFILETPICGLRLVDRNSSVLMSRITDILHVIIDGVRQQQIQCITMIFHQKTNIDNVIEFRIFFIHFNRFLKI